MNKKLNSFEHILREKGILLYTNQGTSMWPLIKEGKDVLVITNDVSQIKKGDIILTKRPSGRYLLHRVIRICKNGTFVICGDNSYKCDKNITKTEILGKLSSIIRNGKKNNLNGIRYNVYTFVLCKFFCIRKPLLKIIKLIHRFYELQ